MQPDFELTSIIMFYGIAVATFAFALWRGGPPEKLAVAIMVAAFSFQSACYALIPPRFLEIDAASLLTDLICLIGLGWLALNAKRAWPIWATALILVSTASHISRLIHIEIEPLVYSIMRTTPTGCVLLLIAAGTFAYRRRLKLNGEDSNWVDWQDVTRKRFVPSRAPRLEE